MTQPYNMEYKRYFKVHEHENKLEDVISAYLSEEEKSYILTKKNRATQIISLQSTHLRQLEESGTIENFRYIQLENILKDLYDHQGKSERIKNYPYPRQFATLNIFFIRLFTILVPFGMVKEFDKIGEELLKKGLTYGDYIVWLSIPVSVLISWVFTSLEMIGESTENPFEGSSNDVPITSISRTIEIDLRDMLDETNLPPAITAENNILL